MYKYTLAQEKRLAKQGRTEEFNTEFYKTVERGVFKEITKEEMAAWDGPVNYISHGGSLQGRAPLHDTAADLHEQQPETTPPGVAVSQRLPD